MKKVLFIFTLVVGGFLISKGQTPTEIYNAFSKEKNVTSVNISGSLLKMVDMEDDTFKKVESVLVLSFEGCKQAVKDSFAQKVNGLQAKGYETIVRSNKDDKMVKVLAKVNGDSISELLVVVTGSKSALVLVKGDISKSDLQSKSNMLSFNI